MALAVTQANFPKEVLQADKPVLVDFWASWCGPCMRQGPILEKFAEANPAVKVVKVNVDEEPALAEQFQIMSIPSLLVFKQGKLVNATVGLHSAADLAELVK